MVIITYFSFQIILTTAPLSFKIDISFGVCVNSLSYIISQQTPGIEEYQKFL